MSNPHILARHFNNNLELCRFNNCGVRTLGKIIRIRKEANLKHIQRMCEPLYADYRSDEKQQKLNNCNDISAYGANRQLAFGNHRCGATVEQYLFSRYKRTLRFSDLPCICVGENPDYYPLECLRFHLDDDDDEEEEEELANSLEQKLNISSSSSSCSSSTS